MKVMIRPLLLAAGLLAAVPAFAQFQKPEDALKYRKAVMTLMNNHMGRINAQLKADHPDLKAVASSAALIETLSVLPFEAFVKDSALPESRAKPEVWSEADKFKAAAEKMQAAAAKLAAAVKGGDVAAIKTAYGATGGACKDCHDTYRAK